jgi:multidrug resistance efflux pump
MKKKSARKSHTLKRYYLHHLVPVVVWLGALGCVVWLFQRQAERFEVVGIAQGQVRQVATTSTGRIRDIRVELFQPVQAGQTLAVVDTILDNEQTLEAELQAQLGTVTAEIEHLVAQLVPTQDVMEAEAANMEVSRTSDLRRFSVDVENARLRILELQALIASDRITLHDLAMEVVILQKLVEEEAIAPYELEKMQVQHDSLAKKIEENTELLAQAEADLEEAQRRREQFKRKEVVHPSVDHALEVIRREIRVQEEMMKGLLQQLEALEAREAVELTSPIDGVVIPLYVQANEAIQQRPGEHVMRRTGEVVTAGEPVLAVAQKAPTEIVAYASERQIGLLKDDMQVQLVKSTPPAQIAQSRILAIGPTVEIKPQRLWRNPTVPEWGRPVLIDIPRGLAVVPGEVVGIRGL